MNEHKAGASELYRVVNGVMHRLPGPAGSTENSTTSPDAPSVPMSPSLPSGGARGAMKSATARGDVLSNAEVERINYIHRQRARHRVVPYCDIDFLLQMLAKLGVLFHGADRT